MAIDTASFLLFIIRVFIAVVIAIAFPIILMPQGAWADLDWWQWSAVIVILIALIIEQSFLCWPRFETVREIEKRARDKE